MSGKLDPLLRAMLFTRTPRPRLAKRPPGAETDRLRRRVAQLGLEADDAGAGGGAVLAGQLPDADAENIGTIMVVRSAAGQPAGIFVGGQRGDDTLFWQQVSRVEAPFWIAFERGSVVGTGNPFSDAEGIVAVSNTVLVANENQGTIVRMSKDLATQLAVHGPSATLPDSPGRLAYDATLDRVGIIGTDAATRDGFQVWDAALSARVFQVSANGSGNGQFNTAAGIAAGGSGNWIVTDFGNNRVQIFNSLGAYNSQFGSAGSGNGQFAGPLGVCLDHLGMIHVVDSGNFRVQVFNGSGVFQYAYGSQGNGPGQFRTPRAIARHLQGLIFVTDEDDSGGSNGVQVFTSGGEFITSFASQAYVNIGAGKTDIDVREDRVYTAAGGAQLWRTSLRPNRVPAVTMRTNTVAYGSNTNGEVTASCNTDEVCIGGGFNTGNLTAGTIVQKSEPNGNGWRVNSRNTGVGSVTLTAYAICLSVPL